MKPSDQNVQCRLTHAQLRAACDNVGVDLTCGGCAGVFFTGGRWNKCDPGCKSMAHMKCEVEMVAGQ